VGQLIEVCTNRFVVPRRNAIFRDGLFGLSNRLDDRLIDPNTWLPLGVGIARQPCRDDLPFALTTIPIGIYFTPLQIQQHGGFSVRARTGCLQFIRDGLGTFNANVVGLHLALGSQGIPGITGHARVPLRRLNQTFDRLLDLPLGLAPLAQLITKLRDLSKQTIDSFKGLLGIFIGPVTHRFAGLTQAIGQLLTYLFAAFVALLALLQ